MATDEYQHQDDYSHGVDLVRLVSNEFGSATSIVRMQVAIGDIYLDDEKYEGEDKFFIPYEQVKGKEIKVIGPDRSWRLDFKG